LKCDTSEGVKLHFLGSAEVHNMCMFKYTFGVVFKKNFLELIILTWDTSEGVKLHYLGSTGIHKIILLICLYKNKHFGVVFLEKIFGINYFGTADPKKCNLTPSEVSHVKIINAKQFLLKNYPEMYIII
jgi:hypothetical protein